MKTNTTRKHLQTNWTLYGPSMWSIWVNLHLIARVTLAGNTYRATIRGVGEFRSDSRDAVTEWVQDTLIRQEQEASEEVS